MMFPPTNPVAAVQQVVRERISDKRIPEHVFSPMYVNLPTAYCKHRVNGNLCTRPATHPCHRKVDEADVCGACKDGKMSWTMCVCDQLCDAKNCRHSVYDSFDYTKVPVPRFRKD